jgi:glyoxylase-like metal-dependent hydrolase (beta-lactamase superfamily II)
MIITPYPSDLLASNMYVIKEGGHAVVIDPSRDFGPACGLTIDKILITHEHYDHISGVNTWKEVSHAPLLCSARCAEQIKDPKRNIARHFDVFCELQTMLPDYTVPGVDPAYSCVADETFEDRFCFDWREHRFRLFEIPGHSPGSIGILLDEKHFFSGDSLLNNRETELRFPGGNIEQWKKIGEPRIRAIPSGCLVWPGHFECFDYS